MRIEVRKPTEEEIKTSKTWSTWSKDISEFSWSYHEKETCLILQGKAEVEGKDGSRIEFGAGDFVIFPKGLDCVWRIKESIEKKYHFGE